MRRPWVIAHRGASAVAPENTLAAFDRAFADGADGIELDTTLSAEGVPVVIHDDTLDRTAGRPGYVWTKPVAELRALDAGSWFGASFAGQRIPTLAEVLELARGRGIVNVEIKSGWKSRQHGGPKPRVLAKAVVRVIEAHGDPEQVIVSSFDPRVLRNVRRRAPSIRTGYLRWHKQRRPFAPLAWWAGADFIHPDVPFADEAARHAGGWEKLLVWTVDDGEEQARLAAQGVLGIITNRPAEARKRLARRP